MKMTRQQSQLLRILQEDASLSHEELSEKLGRSRQAIGRDLKDLEEGGVIERRTVVIDGQKIGLSNTVYILVELKTHGAGQLDVFEATVREHFPNAIELALIQGSWDFLLKFVVRDNSHFAEVLRKLTNTLNVSRTCSYGSIGVPRLYPLPLGDEQQYR